MVCQERTPGLDRTTDLFMDVLKRNGIKPEWIERQNRISEMTDLLHQRIRAEYALAMLDASSSRRPSDDAPVPPLCPERFRDRVRGVASLQDDLAFLNREIDTYNLQVRKEPASQPGGGPAGDTPGMPSVNWLAHLRLPVPLVLLVCAGDGPWCVLLQVPSLHLQRLRVKLDQLVAQATWSGTPKTLHEAHQVGRRQAGTSSGCSLSDPHPHPLLLSMALAGWLAADAPHGGPRGSAGRDVPHHLPGPPVRRPRPPRPTPPRTRHRVSTSSAHRRRLI